MRRPGTRSPLSRIDDLALQQALFEQPRHGGPRSWRASGRPQRLIPCLPICVAILAIASFPQTLSRAMRLPAFPSPTSCYFRPTNENTGNIPNEKIRQLCSSSGGSLHLSAICWQTLAVSLRTSNTTRSMLRRVQDRHAARTAQAGSTDASAPHRRCHRSVC